MPNQSTQRGATAQRGAATSARNAVEPDATRSRSDEQSRDRERSIETRRERSDGTGIVRQRPWNAPAVGGAVTPFVAARRMLDDMDRIFQDFSLGRSAFGLSPLLGRSLEVEPWSEPSAASGAAWMPQIETFRRGDKMVVRADLPGMTREDVNVDVDDGILSISGERRDEHEEDRDGYYRSERSYGQFYRAIPLPDGVDTDRVEASFNNGVLEVTLPAPKEAQSRRKRVQVR